VVVNVPSSKVFRRRGGLSSLEELVFIHTDPKAAIVEKYSDEQFVKVLTGAYGLISPFGSSGLSSLLQKEAMVHDSINPNKVDLVEVQNLCERLLTFETINTREIAQTDGETFVTNAIKITMQPPSLRTQMSEKGFVTCFDRAL
jgi:hypothetical protein